MTEAYNPKTCTLIGANKGGIGKSFVAATYITAHDEWRHKRIQQHNLSEDQVDPLTVIEIDNEAKLHATMPERVSFSLRVAPDLAAVSRDRRVTERYFNPVFSWWGVGDSITDLGANVTSAMFDWMRQTAVPEMAAERNIHFRFLAVAIPDAQSLKSAKQALELAIDTLGENVSPYLVFNDMFGLDGSTGFLPYKENPDYLEIEAYQREGRIHRINVPFCTSQLMEYGRARNMPVLEVYRREEQIARELDLDEVAQRTERKRLVNWLLEVQQSLAPLFLNRGPVVNEAAAYVQRPDQVQQVRQAAPAQAPQPRPVPTPAARSGPTYTPGHGGQRPVSSPTSAPPPNSSDRTLTGPPRCKQPPRS